MAHWIGRPLLGSEISRNGRPLLGSGDRCLDRGDNCTDRETTARIGRAGAVIGTSLLRTGEHCLDREIAARIARSLHGSANHCSDREITARSSRKWGLSPWLDAGPRKWDFSRRLDATPPVSRSDRGDNCPDREKYCSDRESGSSDRDITAMLRSVDRCSDRQTTARIGKPLLGSGDHCSRKWGLSPWLDGGPEEMAQLGSGDHARIGRPRSDRETTGR